MHDNYTNDFTNERIRLMPIQEKRFDPDGWSTLDPRDFCKTIGPFDLTVTPYPDGRDKPYATWAVFTDAIPGLKCVLGECADVRAAKDLAERFVKVLEPLLKGGL
jgi:hypothetical protein